jgi:hypothetical protein
MSSAMCQSCGRKGSGVKSKEVHNQMIKEANSHLDYLTSAVFPTHFNLKEDVQRNLKVTL